jgi:hypothetical protein
MELSIFHAISVQPDVGAQANGSSVVSVWLWSRSQCSFPILALRFAYSDEASIQEGL